jgi:hypothetical protein
MLSVFPTKNNGHRRIEIDVTGEIVEASYAEKLRLIEGDCYSVASAGQVVRGERVMAFHDGAWRRGTVL